MTVTAVMNVMLMAGIVDAVRRIVNKLIAFLGNVACFHAVTKTHQGEAPEDMEVLTCTVYCMYITSSTLQIISSLLLTSIHFMKDPVS